VVQPLGPQPSATYGVVMAVKDALPRAVLVALATERQKPDFTAPDMSGGFPHKIPYELDVGKEFMTSGRQTEETEEWTRKYRLYAAVYHTFSERPFLMRIKPIPKRGETKEG
jgi:hypothetical protein